MVEYCSKCDFIPRISTLSLYVQPPVMQCKHLFSGDISENILETVVLFHSGMLGKNQPGAEGQQQMIKRVYQQEFYKYWFKLAFNVALQAVGGASG